MSKKRYFIVSYNLSNGKVYGFGQINIVTDGCYPSMQTTNEQIKSNLKYEDVGIVILNVIELSESDYNDWISKQ